MAHTIFSDADCKRFLLFGEVLELQFEDAVVKVRGRHGQAPGLVEDTQQVCDLFDQVLAWFAQHGVVPSE